MCFCKPRDQIDLHLISNLQSRRQIVIHYSLFLTVNILLLLLQVIHTNDLNNNSWGMFQ